MPLLVLGALALGSCRPGAGVSDPLRAGLRAALPVAAECSRTFAAREIPATLWSDVALWSGTCLIPTSSDTQQALAVVVDHQVIMLGSDQAFRWLSALRTAPADTTAEGLSRLLLYRAIVTREVDHRVRLIGTSDDLPQDLRERLRAANVVPASTMVSHDSAQQMWNVRALVYGAGRLYQLVGAVSDAPPHRILIMTCAILWEADAESSDVQPGRACVAR